MIAALQCHFPQFKFLAELRAKQSLNLGFMKKDERRLLEQGHDLVDDVVDRVTVQSSLLSHDEAGLLAELSE
jgi:hypothetical protein